MSWKIATFFFSCEIRFCSFSLYHSSASLQVCSIIDDDSFALRFKWVLRALRNRLAPAIAAGKYFGLFQLKKKKDKIKGPVVIRTVRPHGLLEGIATHYFHSSSSLAIFFFVLASSLFSNTQRRPAATFLVILKTTFNNVETKDFQSWVVLPRHRAVSLKNILLIHYIDKVSLEQKFRSFVIINYIDLHQRFIKLYENIMFFLLLKLLKFS